MRLFDAKAEAILRNLGCTDSTLDCEVGAPR
jgi:hypothetical protein